MSSENAVDFQGYRATGRDNLFSVMKPEEEKLRPVPWDAHYEWDETSMFGFNIPEHGIDCIIYYWHHPTMKTVYGGIMIWEGNNTNQIACAYSDYRLAMPMPDDITDCTYANGVRVKMVTPLEEFDISFEDKSRDTSLKLNLKAIMPPACRYNGGHITQAMKTKGELVLNGKHYVIDGYHSRDRSWNETRLEAHRHIPPINWTVGIMDESFAFHHVSFDNRRHRPEWGDLFPGHGDDNNVLWGYIRDGGETHGVVAVDQETTYGFNPIHPASVRTVLLGSNGKNYKINGRMICNTQIQCWPNMNGSFALMEWDYEGRKGYGDIQMCVWTDAYKFLERWKNQG